MNINLTVTNPRVIGLLESIPRESWNAYIERCILLGDIVTRYAQITTSEETLQRHFEPTMNDLSEAIKMLQQLHNTFHTTLASQTEVLQKLAPALARSVTRGEMTNESIYQSLCQNFREDEAHDVSGKPESADLSFIPEGCKTPVLIELKDLTGKVSSSEVSKFWRDMERQQVRVGVFISMHTPIIGLTSDFVIQRRGKQIGIFLVNKEFSYNGHILAYGLARQLLLALETRHADMDVNKLGLIARILHNQLHQIAEEMRMLDTLRHDLEKAYDDHSTKITRIIKQMDKLQDRVGHIVEDTLRDFVDEFPNTIR